MAHKSAGYPLRSAARSFGKPPVGEIDEPLGGLHIRDKRDRGETIDLDAALRAAYENPRARRGDLFLLGEHRLLCGDATKTEDVERLLEGRRAQMAFTDPPYNVALGDHGGRQPTVSRILAEASGHWSDTVIWAKDRFVLGRADYQRAYEPIWYGWREGVKRQFRGGRGQSDLWEIPRPEESVLHPTMKPLPLIERAVNNSSRVGDVVLDLFVGSGSTLVVAERTGRARYAIELDEHYCSLPIVRWEAFTGEMAEKG